MRDLAAVALALAKPLSAPADADHASRVDAELRLQHVLGQRRQAVHVGDLGQRIDLHRLRELWQDLAGPVAHAAIADGAWREEPRAVVLDPLVQLTAGLGLLLRRRALIKQRGLHKVPACLRQPVKQVAEMAGVAR
eukprot:3343864-Lingulodinium_polyedra.AAC.1